MRPIVTTFTAIEIQWGLLPTTEIWGELKR